MAARHRAMKKAGGGSVPPTQFPGKAVMEEAKEKSDGFKKGGKVKDGGLAHGAKAKARLDKPQKKASGGAVNMRGRSPMSSASKVSEPIYEDG